MLTRKFQSSLSSGSWDVLLRHTHTHTNAQTFFAFQMWAKNDYRQSSALNTTDKKISHSFFCMNVLSYSGSIPAAVRQPISSPVTHSLSVPIHSQELVMFVMILSSSAFISTSQPLRIFPLHNSETSINSSYFNSAQPTLDMSTNTGSSHTLWCSCIWKSSYFWWNQCEMH